MALLNTLKLIKVINCGYRKAEWLADYFNVSDRTLKRMIAEARELGAELKAERTIEGGYWWYCRNWNVIDERGLLERWIELEESRSVVELKDQPDLF